MLTIAAMVMASLVAVLVTGVAPAGATTANPTPLAGSRHSATTLPFLVSGTAQLSVDVGSGNGLFTDQLVTLPGITADVPIQLWYNTSVWGGSVPSSVTNSTGSGWGITGFDQRLIANGDGSVTYYGPGGLSGVFAPDGSGGFIAPPQFQADLTYVSGTGYTLLDHSSQTKLVFTTAGRLTSSVDRDGNTTTFAYSGGEPASITSTRGASAGRVLTISENSSGQISTLSQTSGTLSRSISFGYTTNGHLGTVTDDVGGVTTFTSGGGTDTGQVVNIVNPLSKNTALGFATGGQVAYVAQANPTADGGAGTSTTRFTYPTSTQTLVADPDTNQSNPVSSVPHTTYTLNTALLVTTTQDPDGNSRSTTYTTGGLNNVATVTPASPGGTSSASLSWTANSGESLTGITLPQNASASATYTNTGASLYSPTTSTNDASNSLQYGYASASGDLTSIEQSSVSGTPTATITQNSDGTVATSAGFGAGSVVTSYGYDGYTAPSPCALAADHNLCSITPPSGTSLGTSYYTWDGFGRLATVTDGRGDVITYTYDDADRVTQIQSSVTGTHEVDYSYNAVNEPTQRVDGNGTTTYTYDDLQHVLTVGNTAGSGTISYTYDLNGTLATETSGEGTTTYTYDDAHELTEVTYLQGSTTEHTYFANDANGNRTDAWLQSNATHSGWSAHEHYTYDADGRITTVLGQDGPATSPTTLVNETLCYSSGSTPGTCPSTTPAGDDRTQVQWISDSVTGETAAYAYDTANRIHTVTITGGSNPRTYTYGYNAAGDRTSAAVTGSSPSSQTLTYNAADQITTTGYTYDAAGNLTAWPGHTATYNGYSQMTSSVQSSATTTYTYAGATQNELLSESTSGGQSYTYTYGRDDSNELPEIEATKVGSNTAYLNHDNTGLPVMLQTNTSLTCLYLFDGLGNPTALSTSAGGTSFNIRYDPYGNDTRIDTAGSTGGWNDNPYLFAGATQDRATGLLKNGQRWYNPGTGSWTQQDAINRPLDPSNANRYTYAAGDPVNKADPTGRCFLGLGSGCSSGSVLGGIGVGLGILGAVAAPLSGGLSLALTVGSIGAASAGGYENYGVGGAVAGGLTAAVGAGVGGAFAEGGFDAAGVGAGVGASLVSGLVLP